MEDWICKYPVESWQSYRKQHYSNSFIVDLPVLLSMVTSVPLRKLESLQRVAVAELTSRLGSCCPTPSRFTPRKRPSNWSPLRKWMEKGEAMALAMCLGNSIRSSQPLPIFCQFGENYSSVHCSLRSRPNSSPSRTHNSHRSCILQWPEHGRTTSSSSWWWSWTGHLTSNTWGADQNPWNSPHPTNNEISSNIPNIKPPENHGLK